MYGTSTSSRETNTNRHRQISLGAVEIPAQGTPEGIQQEEKKEEKSITNLQILRKSGLSGTSPSAIARLLSDGRRYRQTLLGGTITESFSVSS